MQEETVSKPPESDKDAQALTITDTSLVEIGHRAEALAKAIKQIRAAVLTITNHRDWENLGDKPYLNDGGASKVGQAFGVSTRFLQYPEREDYDDGHFDYTCMVEVEFRGTKVEEGGTGSSRDPFFSKAKGQDIPPAEIDRNDVKKKSITNATGRAIKRILALKNFTWDELKQAGIDKDKVSKVEYATDPVLPKYGDYAGKPIKDAPSEVLLNYKAGLERSIKDPTKERFKANNQRILAAIDAELATREAAAATSKPATEKPAKESAKGQKAQPAPSKDDATAFSELADSLADDHVWQETYEHELCAPKNKGAFEKAKKELQLDNVAFLRGADRARFVQCWRKHGGG